jgi:hypothetical protein
MPKMMSGSLILLRTMCLLIYCAFNLRRIFNLADKNAIKVYLEALILISPRILSYFKPEPGMLMFTLQNSVRKTSLAKAA